MSVVQPSIVSVRTEPPPDRLGAVCDALAAALEYPRGRTAVAAREAARGLDDAAAAAALAASLAELARFVEEARDGEPEERYASLFDLKPVATLHCGYHILGDTYDRGNLLALLVGELARRGVPWDHDLPDFLPTLLRLLGALPPGEERALLLYPVILPGLAGINAALSKASGPYPHVLAALDAWLRQIVPSCGVDIDLRHARADPVAGGPICGGSPCSM